MATIVQMPAPRSKTNRSSEREDGATILFFTGIRYVRDEDEQSDEEPMTGVAIGEPPADSADAGLLLI